MAAADRFEGHLKRIAEEASQIVASIVWIRPDQREGRPVVGIRVQGAKARGEVWMRLNQFCEDEGIPHDYSICAYLPLPFDRPEPLRQMYGKDLPEGWPPEA